MALETLFLDGFDHYASADIGKKWPVLAGTPGTDFTIQTSTVRHGSALRFPKNIANKYVSRALEMNARTVVMGFALQVTEAPSSTNIIGMGLLHFLAGGVNQVALVLNPSNQLEFRLGADGTSGTLLGNTTTLATGTWHYIELRFYVDDTAGEWEIRVNGVTAASGTAADTKNSSSLNYVDTVRIGRGYNAETFYDDLYIRGAAGLEAGGFLGDVKIITRYPVGAGSYAQLTSSSGSANWQNVDETTPDLADYNHTNTTGQIDTYDFAALADAGSIKAVQLNLLAAKDDAGSRTIEPYIKSGATEEAQAAQGLSVTPAYKSHVWETDPNTDEAWSETNLNNAEFGARAGA